MHPLKMMIKTVSKVKNICKRKIKDYNNNNTKSTATKLNMYTGL